MPPVAMGCICQFLYTMMVNIEQIKGKTVGMAFASMAAAVTNYVLNLLLIPRFGYIAAAYTTLVGYLLLLGLHMWIVYRMGMSHTYSYRFIVGMLIVTSIFTLLVNAIYAIRVVRYILLLGYLIVLAAAVYRKRNTVSKIVKSFKAEN